MFIRIYSGRELWFTARIAKRKMCPMLRRVNNVGLISYRLKGMPAG
jgi:hypothetical protein